MIPPRRRFLLLATVTLITLFLFLSPSDAIGSSRRLGPGRGRRGATAAKAYEVLKLSSSAALALVPEGYPPSANKAKILESRSNPYGYMVSLLCFPTPSTESRLIESCMSPSSHSGTIRTSSTLMSAERSTRVYWSYPIRPGSDGVTCTFPNASSQRGWRGIHLM